MIEPMDSVVYSGFIRSIGTLKANLFLNCNATGIPAPTITWYRKGIELTFRSVVEVTNGSMVNGSLINGSMVNGSLINGSMVEMTDGFVSNGILALNVTEGVDATRSGLLYHCEATNIIGQSDPITATIRSRDANVTYACEYGIYAIKIYCFQMKLLQKMYNFGNLPLVNKLYLVHTAWDVYTK